MHITTINNYQDITDELFGDIINSGLMGEIEKIFVCILGGGNVNLPTDSKIEVLLEDRDINLYEFATLNKIIDFSKSSEGEHNVLYLHLKGLTSNNTNQCIVDWRRYMSYFNIYKHDECFKLLEDNDTCGVDLRNTPVLHYSGNFWWTTTSHVKKLRSFGELPVILSERHKAEFWLCSDKDGKYSSMWDCGIDVYSRHLHRYEEKKYKNT